MISEIAEAIREACAEHDQGTELATKLIAWIDDVANGNDGLQEASHHARVVTDSVTHPAANTGDIEP
jgi:hypothetical protein